MNESKTKILPNGWRSARLGEVCETATGGTPSRGNPNYFGGDIPWVKSGELEDVTIFDTEEKITREGLEHSNAKIFPAGTLLIALYGATVGKLGILGIDATTNQAVCAIFPDAEQVDTNYLFHFLFQERENLLAQSFGGAQPNISQAIVRDIQILLPPLPEQHRIAAQLNEIMAEVARARDAAQSQLDALNALPAAYLKKAFRGEL